MDELFAIILFLVPIVIVIVFEIINRKNNKSRLLKYLVPGVLFLSYFCFNESYNEIALMSKISTLIICLFIDIFGVKLIREKEVVNVGNRKKMSLVAKIAMIVAVIYVIIWPEEFLGGIGISIFVIIMGGPISLLIFLVIMLIKTFVKNLNSDDENEDNGVTEEKVDKEEEK